MPLFIACSTSFNQKFNNFKVKNIAPVVLLSVVQSTAYTSAFLEFEYVTSLNR